MRYIQTLCCEKYLGFMTAVVDYTNKKCKLALAVSRYR